MIVRLATTHPLPDWHKDELVIVIPVAEMEADSAFDAELAALFAARLNVKLKLLHQTSDEAILSLSSDRAHLATGLRARSNLALRFSSSYQTLDERVICGDGTPKTIERLYEKQLAVALDSPQEAVLRELREEHDDLEWTSRKRTSPVQLLQEVAEGKLECTLAN